MNKKYLFLGISIALVISSCQKEKLSSNEIANFSTKAIGEPEKLQVKSFNQSSDFGPKPIDDMSKTVPDSTPQLDLVTNRTLKKQVMGDAPFPHGRKNNEFSTKTCCGSGALHWGARIAKITSPVNNKWGVYAGHKINVTQTFPQADTLVYSPTTMPPNKTPLEVVSVYYRPPGSANASDTGRVFGIWDHTGTIGKPWFVYKDMTDTTWQNKYTANFTDGRFFYTQIVKTSSTSNTFTVLLYNFQTGVWENQGNNTLTLPTTFNTTTTTASDNGWSFHEPKFDDICPSLLPLKSKSVQVWDGGSWYNNTPAKGSSLISGSLTCTNWTKVMINNHYNWSIN